MTTMILNVNGQDVKLPEEVDPQTPLLYVLRNDLKINSPKYGCGLGECGACTVLLDGVAMRSCSVPVSAAQGKKITTLEAKEQDRVLHVVQQAFIAKQAAQCGYCTNGMVTTLTALFKRNLNVSEEEIKKELAFNLCRCGAHFEIIEAAKQAQKLLQAQGV